MSELIMTNELYRIAIENYEKANNCKVVVIDHQSAWGTTEELKEIVSQITGSVEIGKRLLASMNPTPAQQFINNKIKWKTERWKR